VSPLGAVVLSTQNLELSDLSGSDGVLTDSQTRLTGPTDSFVQSPKRGGRGMFNTYAAR